MKKLLGLFLLLTVRLGAALVSVQSSQVRVLAEPNVFWAYFETAGGPDLLYYDPINYPSTGTSRVVFNLNGTPVDMQSTVLPGEVVIPVTTSGSGLGAYVEMAKRYGNLVYGVRYTIVADPHTGSGAGFVQIKAWVTNNTPVAASVGLRLLLDTQLIDTTHDNAPLSLDNGQSLIDRNTLIQGISSSVPSDWWTYDQDPFPTLAARGVTWGNSYGLPASQPDAVEFCQWDQVANDGFYDTHPAPGQLFSSYPRPDTAVALWYTNTGQALGNGYPVAPGETLQFVTYYGINTGALHTTPTPYISFTNTPTRTPTPSISPTHTISPTFTVSPTISPTHTISPTFTVSPTFSVSPTISNTYTVSPTLTVTQTFTHSPTTTPTPSVTPSYTVSNTFTVSPTYTATRTASPTPTASATYTVSPTHTISPTHSVSPTLAPTQPPSLELTPKPPNPNPGTGTGMWLPYILSRDAEVKIRIFTVAGEKVRDLAPFDGKLGPNEQYWDERNEAGARVGSGIFIAHIVARAGGESDDAFVKMAVVR